MELGCCCLVSCADRDSDGAETENSGWEFSAVVHLLLQVFHREEGIHL